MASNVKQGHNFALYHPLSTDHHASSCRHCQLGNEDIHHIVNCYIVSSQLTKINEEAIYGESCDIKEMEKIASYVKKYLEIEDE